MSELIIHSGKHKGRKIPIPTKEVVIGRDEGCFLRLNSTDVSRQHCTLRSTPQGIVVKDLGSRNGTYVNDEPVVGEILLGPGDVLRIGPAELAVPGARPDSSLDEDIASWLTDGDTDATGERPGDTAIIKATPRPDSAAEMHALLAKTPLPPSRPKREFKSVAEEAQDIIRRHYEWLAARDADAR